MNHSIIWRLYPHTVSHIKSISYTKRTRIHRKWILAQHQQISMHELEHDEVKINKRHWSDECVCVCVYFICESWMQVHRRRHQTHQNSTKIQFSHALQATAVTLDADIYIYIYTWDARLSEIHTWLISNAKISQVHEFFPFTVCGATYTHHTYIHMDIFMCWMNS